MTSAPSLDPADQASHADASPRHLSSGGLSWTALWTLYVLTLRQYSHGKRWMVLVGLFLLPPGLALLVRATAPNVPSMALEFLFAYMFIPQAILPLVALIYASGMIQDEQEEQTITYLLIRPIPKWALYVVKLLATITTTVLLTAIFTGLTYAAIYLGADTQGANIPLRCLRTISIHGLAVVSYCCLFGFISVLTKRTLIVGIIYTMVVEGLLANLPFGIRLATIIYYTRLIAYRTMEFAIATPKGSKNIAAEAWQFDFKTDPDLLEHLQLVTCLAVLLVGSLICTALAAYLCSQKEFYVKTPERN